MMEIWKEGRRDKTKDGETGGKKKMINQDGYGDQKKEEGRKPEKKDTEPGSMREIGTIKTAA
jgi:hypothetical protein